MNPAHGYAASRRRWLRAVGMLGIGPSLAHADTPLARQGIARPVAPAVLSARYQASFVDEFDDRDLSRFNEDGIASVPGRPAWRSRMRQPRKDIINQEKQIYVDRAYAGLAGRPLGIEPFELDGSSLSLIARPLADAAQRAALHGMGYSSGCISSERAHAQRYGYFEMRARLPRGRGFWPAFWMLPVRDTWPPEIDIMEASGDRPGMLHFSVRKPGDRAGRGSGWLHAPVAADGWQVFACEWTEREIRFIVDGRRLWSVRDHGVHEPMYLLANLALGSHDPGWIPDPDASTPFPGRFEIDYIRAFERR
ncbi:MAG: glycoside hydrolase family 16 protein [Burkholderiaceae bacterium]